MKEMNMTTNPITEEKPVKRRVEKVTLTPPEKKEPSKEGNFMTPGGGELEITFGKRYGLYEIYFRTGGPLPKELQGKFTEISRAEYAIESYLNRKK